MDKFLLAGEAGRIMKCSAQNVVKLERSGKLKALKTPTGVRLFSEQDVLELAARRKQKDSKYCRGAATIRT
jgi:DNA-binding transcriptional MerR regulator